MFRGFKSHPFRQPIPTKEKAMRQLPGPSNYNVAGFGFGIGSIVLGLLAVMLFFGGFFTVDAGHVGVIKRFGAVQPGVYYPGLHFKWPFLDGVEHVDVRLDSVDAKADAASKDLQVVAVQVSVPYSLEPGMVPEMINILGTRQRFEKAILANAIQESVKGATAGYSAEELITKRNESKAQIVRAITAFVNDTLNKKGLSGLAPIANVAISDFDFSREFNQAIEAKVKMQEDAKRAEIEKLKTVTDAEAKAEQVKLAADAEAYRTKAEAISRAEAINAEGQALRNNPGLVQLRIAEKWDGVLPRFSGGQLPFLMMDPTKEEQPQRPAINAVR
jgi:prohibitin 2